MTALVHRTGTGHLPALRAVSWSCGCGCGEVSDYGLSVEAAWALRYADVRAATHRSLAALKETHGRA
jgi:hypothetical protein